MNTPLSSPEPNPVLSASIRPVIIVFLAVLLACLVGIWSRPAGFLASIWPANALLLGILLRLPGAAHPASWLAAAAAFLTADLLTESSIFKAAILNSANLLSVGIAYFLLKRQPVAITRMQQPVSMLYIVFAAMVGGAAAGLVGAIANPVLFNESILNGFTFWWVSEVVNYVAILPIVLSLPDEKQIQQLLVRRQSAIRKHDLLPALAVLLSCLAAALIGGPGAIAFPVLALLWCAMVYPVFLTAILTLCCSMFVLLLMPGTHYPYSDTIDMAAISSIRLGVSVMTITPIMLSIVIRNRNDLLSELRYLSLHDSLTGVSNRTAFFQDARRLLRNSQCQHAIMMIDLDHFKSINDTYGHAAGDCVLRQVAERISHCLRPTDKLSRMGGEEFAVFLHNCAQPAAIEIAERIRLTIAATPITAVTQHTITVTASIGLTFAHEGNLLSVEQLLVQADTALYQGKRHGRNRVELAMP